MTLDRDTVLSVPPGRSAPDPAVLERVLDGLRDLPAADLSSRPDPSPDDPGDEDVPVLPLPRRRR